MNDAEIDQAFADKISNDPEIAKLVGMFIDRYPGSDRYLHDLMKLAFLRGRVDALNVLTTKLGGVQKQ